MYMKHTFTVSVAVLECMVRDRMWDVRYDHFKILWFYSDGTDKLCTECPMHQTGALGYESFT